MRKVMENRRQDRDERRKKWKRKNGKERMIRDKEEREYRWDNNMTRERRIREREKGKGDRETWKSI